jgi:hypothetical protein
MTMCSTYIGDLDDLSFAWDGGNWNGNVPRAISRDFPPVSRPYVDARRAFHDWVAISGVKCKQTDFEGWVAVVTRRQIEDFIAFSAARPCYQGDHLAPTQKRP